MKKGKSKARRALFIILAFAAVLALIIFDSANRLTVTHFELSHENLPHSFDGFKIVQLSDLHLHQFGEDNVRLAERVAEESPDIIVLTGDFINRRLADVQAGQSEKLRGFFSNLSEIAPCYFVSGNHEWASGEIESLAAILDETEIRYLRNEYVTLERQGEQIILAGVEDPNGPVGQIRPDVLVRNLREDYPEDFVVFLGHRDNWPERYPALDVDLIFSGHGHGGVIRLPLIGGLFSTEYRLFPRYDAGFYNEGNYDFVLSRGLGNFNAIPRFLNPPEIVSVTLQRKK